MDYLITAFSAEPMAVRVMQTLLGMLSAHGRKASGFLIPYTRPEEIAKVFEKYPVPKDVAVISINYPRKAFCGGMDRVRDFIIWREQSQMDWEKDPEVINDFNSRPATLAFGYTEGMEAFRQTHVHPSLYAVPVLDLLPFTGWRLPFSAQRRYTIAMVSNRGGRDIKENSEWNQKERAHRNEVAELVRFIYGDKLALAGDGWNHLRGMGIVSFQRSAGLYTDSIYGLHASNHRGWHHRLAEILLCGALPVVRAGTAGCMDPDVNMRLLTDFASAYIKGCHSAVMSVIYRMETGCPQLVVEMPSTPCLFYEKPQDLESFEEFNDWH